MCCVVLCVCVVFKNMRLGVLTLKFYYFYTRDL